MQDTRMNRPIGFGIVGSGFGVDVILPALLANPEFDVRSIAVGKSSTGTDKLRGRLTNIAAVSVEELLEANDIQAVVIAVPPHIQAELIGMALLAGKHVICEKPFTASLEEATIACRAASKEARFIAIDYEFRYDPLVTSCLRGIASGYLGELKQIKIRWWTGSALREDRPWSWRDDSKCCGGVLTEWCSHIIDYVPLLADSSFYDIGCVLRTDQRTRRGNDGRHYEVNTPDGCIINATLTNAVEVSIDVSTAQSALLGHFIEIHGENGVFRAEITPPYTASNLRLSLNNNHIREFKLDDVAMSNDIRVDAVAKLAKDFGAVIGGSSDAPLLPRCQEGVSVWEVLGAARISSEGGGCRMLVKPNFSI